MGETREGRPTETGRFIYQSGNGKTATADPFVYWDNIGGDKLKAAFSNEGPCTAQYLISSNLKEIRIPKRETT